MADERETGWGAFMGQLSIGRLGAIARPEHSSAAMAACQMDMIERRILRLEAALLQAGIDVQSMELPE